MSCIEVRVSRLGGISAGALRVGGIGARTMRAGGIGAGACRVGGIGVATHRRGGISAGVSLVCTVGFGRYLRVVPQEAQWINVDMSVDYAVLSNTEWEIT